MQAAFHHRLLFFNHHPPPSNLFPPAATAPPRRRITTRCASTNLPDAAASSATTSFEDYQLLFSSQPAESTDPLPLRAAEGSLPADFPLGTYYLVGPGMITDHLGSTINPLDGHGYLRAFRFMRGGVVMYSARYVETDAVREEREVGTGEWRFRRPGIFSKLKSRGTFPWPSMIKNVANTTVLKWGGRLFCLWEGGHPYEIETESLATVGPADIIKAAEERWRRGGGAELAPPGITRHLLHGLLGMPPKRTLSHYKIDAQKNRLLLLACDAEDMLLPHSNFTFYEFDSNFELKQKKEFLIPDQLLIHDWAFTDSHYILMGNRIKLNVPGAFLAMTGLVPMISSVTLNPSQPTTPIYLLPRFSNGTNLIRDWKIPLEAPSQLWTSHVGNAYEEKDEVGNTKIKIQASVCSYQWLNFKKMFGYHWKSQKLNPSFMNPEKEDQLPHLVQISIELNARGSWLGCSIANSSIQDKRPADFPVINPINSGKTNRFMYASSTSGSRKFLPHFPFDTVLKLDCFNGVVKSWWTGSRRFIGEPMFISKRTPDEEDGYIVVIEYAVSRQRCYDAKRIGHDDAVVVKLEVPEHLRFPLGFHGFWDGK